MNHHPGEIHAWKEQDIEFPGQPAPVRKRECTTCDLIQLWHSECESWLQGPDVILLPFEALRG